MAVLPIRVVMVGAGWRAHTHLKAYQRLSEFEVVGICDPALERAQVAAGIYEIPEVAPNLAILLECVMSDAVHICTPPVLHYDLVCLAFAHGKHVFCEKPLTISVEDARRLVELRAATGLVLQVGFQYRFDPYIEQIKHIIDCGEIGRLDYLQLRMSHDWGGRRPTGWFLDPRVAGGGVLIDMGSHLLDLAEYLGGSIECLNSNALVVPDQEVESLAQCAFALASGALGHLVCSWQCRVGREVFIRADGDRATIEFCDRVGTRTLDMINRGTRSTNWQHLHRRTVYPAKGVERSKTSYGHAASDGIHDVTQRQLRSLARSIIQGEPVQSDVIVGHRAVELVSAAYESIRSRRYIDVHGQLN